MSHRSLEQRSSLAALPSVLTDQSSVCPQRARCLSSEHATIAKEQTAKAIANCASAYEKNGVEAALCEVVLCLSPGGSGQASAAPVPVSL